MSELVLEELDVRKGVVRSGRHRIAFEVRPSGRVNHVDERAGLTKIVEEFVTEATALMRLRDQPGDIEQLDGDEPCALLARRVVRLASMADLPVRAGLSDEGHTTVRFDGREGIVRDLDRRERCRS